MTSEDKFCPTQRSQRSLRFFTYLPQPSECGMVALRQPPSVTISPRPTFDLFKIIRKSINAGKSIHEACGINDDDKVLIHAQLQWYCVSH